MSKKTQKADLVVVLFDGAEDAEADPGFTADAPGNFCLAWDANVEIIEENGIEYVNVAGEYTDDTDVSGKVELSAPRTMVAIFWKYPPAHE